MKPSYLWYERAHEGIQRQFGSEWHYWAGLLAACSPNTTVKNSVRLAYRADALLRAGRPRTGFLPAVSANVWQVWCDLLPRGPKVRPFYENLCLNLAPVTVDRWMCWVYGYGKNPTQEAREVITNSVLRLAEWLNVRPAHVQSAIWCKAIQSQGRQVPDLGELLAQGRLKWS